MNLERPPTWRDRTVSTFKLEQIDLFWEEIVALLESVPGFAEFYDPAWVYQNLQEGQVQLWALIERDTVEGVALTQIKVLPRAKTFNVLAAAGQFLPLLDQMEATFEWLARDSGCTHFQAQVRPGLDRKFRSRIDRRSVLLTRRLTQGVQ